MKSLKFKPCFVKTRNARNFVSTMEALDIAAGEGRLGLVWGQAGRGKTRTAQWYAAQNACVYMRALSIWAGSELGFLRTLCVELGLKNPPGRKETCFWECVHRLSAAPRIVIIDEVDQLPASFLRVIRDLSDTSACAFVLVGEEELPHIMQRNRRVWSRTCQQIEFEPLALSEVVYFAREAADVTLAEDAARFIHAKCCGDFRLAKRHLTACMQACAGYGRTEVSLEIAKAAIEVTLSPETNGNGGH